MKILLIFGSALLLFFISFSANADDSLSSRISFEGASITRGFGASKSLKSRLLGYLTQESISVQQKISLKQTTVAFDYFFPTAFRELSSGTEQEFRARVASTFTRWLSQDQIVMIGLLPEWDRLSDLNRSYIASEGRPFSYWFSAINECCIARTRYVNEKIRTYARSHPNIIVMDWTELISKFQTGEITETPARVMADPLHLNSKGQEILFHHYLNGQFEKAWKVDLQF